MIIRSVNLPLLLTVAIGVAALQSGWRTGSALLHGGSHVHHAPAAHHQHHGHHHVHHHVHHHGGTTHSHAHHHHHGDPHDPDSEDHHGATDVLPDLLTFLWVGPRRIEIDAPPKEPALPGPATGVPSGWRPRQRAKPPPPAPARTSRDAALRTIVLRL
ncbi:MAG: hypothetical protein ACYTJ0_04405 [Planctomycetota bacterium]